VFGTDCLRKDGGQPGADLGFLGRLITRLHRCLTSDLLPAAERADAGRSLSVLGDPRFSPERWYLPKDDSLGFRQIPAGPFLMGTREVDVADIAKRLGADRGLLDLETPRYSADTPEYLVGRWPVTNAQSQEFVRDAGHATKGYWSEALGAKRWHDGRLDCWTWLPQASDHVLRTSASGPHTYGGVADLLNHPVVGVSWYEAMAYCSCNH
jgi:formylglycine-generating enzyme required for sulfatase activity